MRRLPDDIDARLRVVAARFAAQGGELRLAEVAKKSGVPRATLYYHFAGRDELLAHLFRVVLADNRDAVAKAIAEADDPMARFEAAITAEVRYVASEPALCRALYTNLDRLGDLRELAIHGRSAFHDQVAAVIEQGCEDGVFRPVPDMESTVSALYGAISLTVLHYAITEPDDIDVDRITTAVLDLVRPGLLR